MGIIVLVFRLVRDGGKSTCYEFPGRNVFIRAKKIERKECEAGTVGWLI